MCIPRHLFLALASWLTVVFGEDIPFSYDDASDLGEQEPSSGLDLVGYPLPGPQCNNWVGLEMIFMVETTEVCPEGSTATSTVTECVETLTRSICATPTTNLPCYPCVMSTLSPSDTVTVTMTSCSTQTDQTITVTLQPCSTCPATTYVGTVPGYTPGGPCHGCSPYSINPSPSSSSSTSSSSSSSSCTDGGEPTTTTTTTSTSIVSTGACAGSGGGKSTSSPPGNPGLPSSTTGSACGPGLSVTATHTPTGTEAPPVVTAGGVRNGVGIGDVAVIGWVAAVVGGFLGI